MREVTDLPKGLLESGLAKGDLIQIDGKVYIKELSDKLEARVTQLDQQIQDLEYVDQELLKLVRVLMDKVYKNG